MNSTWQVNNEVLSSKIDEEAILMSLEAESYFGLDPVGSRIWELLAEQPATTDELIGLLMQEYEVNETTCREHVEHFLDDMQANGLIKQIADSSIMNNFIPKRKLSFSEIMLIPEALLVLFIFRLKVSYQPSRKWMPKATTEVSENIEAENMEKALLVAKVLDGLENRTPWKNTCLVKALAARHMLKQRLINHKIHIGVAAKLNNQFGAHAWLSVGNKNILGGENLEGFHEISAFQ